MTPLQTDPSSGFPAGLRKRPTVDELSEMLGGEVEEPKTLYINRPLKNAAALIEWARAAGFKKTLPASDMHVTIAFSKTPVDWDAINEAVDAVMVPTGVRSIEPLGDKGAVVLRFESPELSARWQEIKNDGAVWDYPTYQPHVTITYDAGDLNYSGIEPFMEPLEFGPERRAEVDGGWADKAKASLVGDETIKNQEIKVRSDLVAADSALVLALDRESVRDKDRDGRLRVATANISKATVNPYKGHEIPDWEKLGLEPNHIYQLLRCPEELKKAVDSFNGVQVLRKHIPVSADDHQPWDVVGTTGTDAEFNDPYLTNSLSIWSRDAIDDIESEAKKELSCGYHYVADMTPGEFSGMRYDGVMREIVGNHVALVKDGRAGPDVVVGDSSEEIKMSNRDVAKEIAARAARQTSITALLTYLRPRLAPAHIAMDSKPLGIMAKVFEGVTGATFKNSKPKIAARLRELAKPQLAKDASLDDVEKVLDMLDGHEVDGGDASVSPEQHNAMEAAAHGNGCLDIPKAVGEEFVGRDASEGLSSFLKEKGMGEDDIAAAKNLAFPPKPATDEDETDEDKKKREKDEADKKAAKANDDAEALKKANEEKAKDAAMKDMVTKPAMDAAIKAATDATAKQVRDTERAIQTAHKDVQPYVGELSMAFDSAEEVYRHALGILGIPEAKTIHASALKTVLGLQPKAGAKPSGNPRIGMDEATVSDFATRFPQAARIQA